VAGVDEPVEQGLGDDRVREQRVPVNRGWDMFRLGYPCCCLVFSGLSWFRDL
jgi:hypothetical protein